jgi:hypothetical protein
MQKNFKSMKSENTLFAKKHNLACLVIVALSVCLSFDSYAANPWSLDRPMSKPQSLQEYLTESLQAAGLYYCDDNKTPFFTWEQNKSFSFNVSCKTSPQKLQDLWLLLMNINFPLTPSSITDENWVKEQDHISKEYPIQRLQELQGKNECASASIINTNSSFWNPYTWGNGWTWDNPSSYWCAVNVFNKMPFDTSANLIMDTVLLGVKFRGEIMTRGTSTYIKKNVPILKRLKTYGEAVKQAKEAKKFWDDLTEGLKVMSQGIAIYNGNNTKNAETQINSIKFHIDDLKKNCDSTFKDKQLCNSLFDETTKRLSEQSKNGSDAIKNLKFISDSHNLELISLVLDLMDEGLIKPLTYSEDEKMLKTFGRVSLTVGGKIPYVGPFADYVKSLSDASDAIRDNKEITNKDFAKFVVEKNSRIINAMWKYQLAALQDTMQTAITADAKSTIVYQELFPQSYQTRSVANGSNPTYIYEAFKNELQEANGGVTTLNGMIAQFMKLPVTEQQKYCTNSNKLFSPWNEKVVYKINIKCGGQSDTKKLFIKYIHQNRSFDVELLLDKKNNPYTIRGLGKHYDDVLNDSIYKPYISYLSRNGVITSSDNFYPDSAVTRAEFYSMYSILNGGTNLLYKKDHWAKKYQIYLNIDINENKLDEPITAKEVISILKIENSVLPNECRLGSSSKHKKTDSPVFSISPVIFKKCNEVSRGFAAKLLANNKGWF